jgi:hypothetical protein
MLIKGMTEQEIRVLQEYRRLASEELDLATIKKIRHPAGGGDAPAWSLVEKGFLIPDEPRERLRLTDKAREFLAIDARPLFEEPGAAAPEPGPAAAES